MARCTRQRQRLPAEDARYVPERGPGPPESDDASLWCIIRFVSELPSRRKRQLALVLGVALTWIAAVWIVVDKFAEYRFPIPLLAVLFWSTLATGSTIVQVRLYRAGEDDRAGG
jgi:hypothetical protein